MKILVRVTYIAQREGGGVIFGLDAIAADGSWTTPASVSVPSIADVDTATKRGTLAAAAIAAASGQIVVAADLVLV